MKKKKQVEKAGKREAKCNHCRTNDKRRTRITRRKDSASWPNGWRRAEINNDCESGQDLIWLIYINIDSYDVSIPLQNEAPAKQTACGYK